MIIKIVTMFLISLSIGFSQNNTTTSEIETQNFILENLDGELVELSEMIGEGPILVSFWATWCKPCKEELKEYNKLYNEYSDDGLNVLAISIDNEKSLPKVKPYIKTNGYDFTVLLDPNSEVARMYYAQMVPYSIIIDNKGEIVYTHLGYKKGDELKVKEIITKLLNLNGQS